VQPSGLIWVQRYPGSVSLDDLLPDFARSVRAFLDALREAGARVRIAATFRPPERAWLMHWCWLIASDKVDPAKVPALNGVDIDWQHLAGKAPDAAAAHKAASQMATAYGIRYAPALVSRHTQRRAIDMSIGWEGALAIRGANGAAHQIATGPRTGQNGNLIAVAQSFGVRKLLNDPPHWSDDGH